MGALHWSSANVYPENDLKLKKVYRNLIINHKTTVIRSGLKKINFDQTVIKITDQLRTCLLYAPKIFVRNEDRGTKNCILLKNLLSQLNLIRQFYSQFFTRRPISPCLLKIFN